MSDEDVLRDLPETLVAERGFPLEGGRCVWIGRKGGAGQDENYRHGVTVGEFLSQPENQSGVWCVDGGWGGPPGPIHVAWVDGRWQSWGFCGRSRP